MTPAFRLSPALPLLAAAFMLAVSSGARAQTPANGDTFTLSPQAYVQFDVRGFPDWDVTPGEGRVARDTIEVRRIRLGVEGRWKRVAYEFSLDPQDADGALVKDAYAQVRFSPRFRLRAGQFKIPGSRDYSVSARATDLLERSPLATSLAVGRDVGARLDGRVARLSYDVGAFAGDGANRDDRASFTAAARVVLDLPNGVEIGGSVSGARTRAHDSDPPNGPSIASSSGYRFVDGVYVKGMRLRLGADAQWTPGNWRFVVEGLRLRDPRRAQGLDLEDLPPAAGVGLSATVVRRLRDGQSARGNPVTTALFRRPLDVALRYDYIGFDDVGTPVGADSVRPRATNIRARAAHGLTLGTTWSAGTWMKVLGNIGIEQYTDPRSAPEAGRRGSYLTAGARLQIELP